MDFDALLQTGSLDLSRSIQQMLGAELAELQRPKPTVAKNLHFQMCNCLDVSQETNRVSYMALPSNVIINVPIVASAVAEAPLTKEHSYFEVEVLSVGPGRENCSLVIGVVLKGFAACDEPGLAAQSVGFKPSVGRVFEDSSEIVLESVDASCVVGDKIGCGLDFQDDFMFVYFTKNDVRVFETPLESTVEWFPAISLSEIKEELRFLTESSWRSIKAPEDPLNGLKMCQETGHLSFKPFQANDTRTKKTLLLANHCFAQQFNFFEIEIIAMGEKDEIAIGLVPANYPRALPGFKPMSAGFHARVGGIFAGRKKRSDKAPVCQVGDKMGCGIEFRSDGERNMYFTHNSKCFMEASITSNCPDTMYPAIGMSTRGHGTVSVCILDPTKWSLSANDLSVKHKQIDMETEVSEKIGSLTVDNETARASFSTSSEEVIDAVHVADVSLTAEQQHFDIELLYGNLITVGLVTATSKDTGAVTKHPGFAAESIGYNAYTGKLHIDGQPASSVGKSTYGDRIRCGVRVNDQNVPVIFFTKNGKPLCEQPYSTTEFTKLYPAVAIRSGGQVSAVRLVDRKLWGLENADEDDDSPNNLLKMVDREIIECPICRDILTDPRILPCMIHTFCAECIRSYISRQDSQRPVQCPVCRSTFTLPPGGISQLPVNTMVTRLLDLRGKFPGSAKPTSNSSTSRVGN